VMRAGTVHTGDAISVQMHDGSFSAVVDEKGSSPGSHGSAQSGKKRISTIKDKARTAGGKGTGNGEQGSLF